MMPMLALLRMPRCLLALSSTAGAAVTERRTTFSRLRRRPLPALPGTALRRSACSAASVARRRLLTGASLSRPVCTAQGAHAAPAAQRCASAAALARAGDARGDSWHCS